MGFYIRKGISVGPFRFNLSKSGVGVSTGVRGFRVGTGPRGNYVHMGRGGLYYRKTLPSGTDGASDTRSTDHGYNIPPPIHDPETGHEPLQAIESTQAGQIVDSSSAELVEELNSKRQKWRIWPFVFATSIVGIWYLAVAGYPTWASLTLAIVGLVLTLAASYFDRLRKTTVLLYDIEDDYAVTYQLLHDAFATMRSCKKKWHMIAEGRVTDRKRNAGASAVVKREKIELKLGMPDFVKTNVRVPRVPVGKQILYFFPDKVLVFEKNAVGGVSYENLDIAAWPQQFIEDERVPRDAQVVDTTWRYVNKSGGPDRRFTNNKKLPIALYEGIHFKSESGLNEEIQLSKAGVGSDFVEAIRGVAHGYLHSPR